MNEEWKEEYKTWKVLKPFQIKLLEEGPKSQSQAWLINTMWCEWQQLKLEKNSTEPIASKNKDPWD
tara:strand:- start:674 stop:871 length:198 start_codon:yes stop_codon:yes gene_type:complete